MSMIFFGPLSIAWVMSTKAVLTDSSVAVVSGIAEP